MSPPPAILAIVVVFLAWSSVVHALGDRTGDPHAVRQAGVAAAPSPSRVST